MIIGGFQKFSLLDYPDKIAAIVFTHGCNFRCPYCHNPELIHGSSTQVPPDFIIDFLKTRTGKLDGVVITGGEPTIHKDLPEFIDQIKALGFLIKLDTNGTNPGMVEKLVQNKRLDYIAMDIKAPLEKYEEITNTNANTEDIKKSIALIKHSGIDHEFRTTIVKDQLVLSDFEQIGKLIGNSRYYLQKFSPSKHLDPTYLEKCSYEDDELLRFKVILENYTDKCFLR